MTNADRRHLIGALAHSARLLLIDAHHQAMDIPDLVLQMELDTLEGRLERLIDAQKPKAAKAATRVSKTGGRPKRLTDGKKKTRAPRSGL